MISLIQVTKVTNIASDVSIMVLSITSNTMSEYQLDNFVNVNITDQLEPVDMSPKSATNSLLDSSMKATPSPLLEGQMVIQAQNVIVKPNPKCALISNYSSVIEPKSF